MPSPSDTNEEPLERLLEQVHDGRIQVPEFQRELMSEDDEWMKSLLASVSLNYPIGAVTLLQAGSPDLRFTSRPVAGAPSSSTEPERLLLDGQHRITRLYQVLASGQAVQTRDDQMKPVDRRYYLDIQAALDPDADRDAAIVSVPDSTLDLTAELQWEQCVFPLRLVFGGEGELRRWQRGFVEHGSAEHTDARSELMERFSADVLQAFHGYLVPTIIVGKEKARWSVRVHGGPDGRSLSDRFRVTRYRFW